jgi:predicted dehydrogenase
MSVQRKLKMGIIGAGPGSFIGPVHYKAAILDNKVEVVAGAFSRDEVKSKKTGRQLFLNPRRVYHNYADMLESEKILPTGERIDFVTIATPNETHFMIAKEALKAGFHVMCEKPMTMNVDEARELQKIVDSTGKTFALMHNYTGYPMVKLARDMVRKGKLGEIRKIIVQYPQGRHKNPLNHLKERKSGSIEDIGTHAENLTEYITGLHMSEVCADLQILKEEPKLDYDGSCLVKFANGSRGIIQFSKIAMGEENNLGIWVYGSEKSIEWHQEQPNILKLYEPESPVQTWRRGNDYIAKVSPAAARASRLPGGHPEAFLEAFANIYRNFCDTIIQSSSGREISAVMNDFPKVSDGLRGMLFVDTVLKSAVSDEKWTKMPKR